MNGIGQNPVFNNPLPSLDGGKGVSAQMITQEQRAKLDKIINAPSRFLDLLCRKLLVLQRG